MLKRSQTKTPVIQTETLASVDDEAQFCLNIWHEFLLMVIQDCQKEEKQHAVYSYLCSNQFEELATLLGLNAAQMRSKLVPASAIAEFAARRLNGVPIIASSEPSIPAKRRVRYQRTKVPRRAVLAAMDRRKIEQASADPETPARPAIAPTRTADGSAVRTAPVSLYAAYANIEADDNFEDGLRELFESASLAEIEGFGERCEIQRIINQMEQAA